jgi:hypothetical protein
MVQDYWNLIQFDLLLAKSDKVQFYQFDLDVILQKVSPKCLERKYCLDWFLENKILIYSSIDQKYYYTWEKISRYKQYQGHQKIVKIVKETDGMGINFNLINLSIEKN